MIVQYMHLDYESYRKLEQQCKEFKETTHTSTGGFYHKSIRLQITPDLTIEYHGPLVGGYGHRDEQTITPDPQGTHIWCAKEKKNRVGYCTSGCDCPRIRLAD